MMDITMGRANSSDIILTFHTGYHALVIQWLEKGCNGYIQKPYSTRELGEKIRFVLDETKQSPSLESS